MRKLILILTTLLLLSAVNVTIYQREELIHAGRLVLLELAPVDPRSLMQGDYMALRFKVVEQAFNRENIETLDDGYLVVTLDERNVATFDRFAQSTVLAKNEARLRYRFRNGRGKLGTNAFFFRRKMPENTKKRASASFVLIWMERRF